MDKLELIKRKQKLLKKAWKLAKTLQSYDKPLLRAE